jgi:nicotinate-nucleotide--dimethylbenzimidazole phosphoribosyltransferase
MKKFDIMRVDQSLEERIRHKIDFKTKPLGALGQLETVALKVGMVQGTLSPTLQSPAMVVLAGDHGIVQEGVSAYPQEVTWQMVMNFIQGGAAINVFCRQHGIDMKVVDAGVNYDFPAGLNGLIYQKVGKGTRNFMNGPAMTDDELERCIALGAKVVTETPGNCIGFGEMGIGNTSAASAIMSVVMDVPVAMCVGAGTGVKDAALARKIEVLERAIAFNRRPTDPYKILATYGGFEIAQMVGAMLQAAAERRVILLDGFIATAAFAIANQIAPAITDYVISCHQSAEKAHEQLLKQLGLQPLLSLGMRLGEGTGAAVAYPIIQSAVNFLNEMASFEAAGVSNKS